MILKTLSRHSPNYRSLLTYILNPEKNTKETITLIKHNLRSTDIEGLIKELALNESYRLHNRKDQVYFTHEILSFSANENPEAVSSSILREVALEYFKLRGYDGQYVAAIHDKEEHKHIHVLASGLKYKTGLAHRMSHKEFHNLKVLLQNFHVKTFPELTESTVSFGQGKKVWKSTHWQEKRSESKVHIQKIIDESLATSKTQNEFYDTLANHGLPFYERDGKPSGLMYNDLKFRFSAFPNLSETLNKLEIDMSEENKMLKEIEMLRNRREERSLNDLREEDFSFE